MTKNDVLRAVLCMGGCGVGGRVRSGVVWDVLMVMFLGYGVDGFWNWS